MVSQCSFNFNDRIPQFLLSLLTELLTEDSPHHLVSGTFALTSLISANAVERIVPQNIQNLTTQSNTSVLGLSDFEMQRIHVAVAVSFLGGVIQVSDTDTWAQRKGHSGKGKAIGVLFLFLFMNLSFQMDKGLMCFIMMEMLFRVITV